MKSKFAIAALAAAVATPMVASAPAEAQYYNSYNSYNGYGGGYQQAQYQPRYYQGRDRAYYEHCRRSSGTTGLLAGGAGGAILGSVLGGGTLGTIAGAVGGGLLGKHLDKRHDAEQNYENGC